MYSGEPGTMVRRMEVIKAGEVRREQMQVKKDELKDDYTAITVATVMGKPGAGEQAMVVMGRSSVTNPVDNQEGK